LDNLELEPSHSRQRASTHKVKLHVLTIRGLFHQLCKPHILCSDGFIF
jgi:hypothetical protein